MSTKDSWILREKEEEFSHFLSCTSINDQPFSMCVIRVIGKVGIVDNCFGFHRMLRSRKVQAFVLLYTILLMNFAPWVREGV